MAIIVDSYSESNHSNDSYIDNSNNFGKGQSFISNGGILNSVVLYLRKAGLPIGNIYVNIYAHSGVYGTSSLPTGLSLAVSDPIDISTLSLSDELKTFTFSGANKITLTDGTYYVLTVTCSSLDTTNRLWVSIDQNSPTHSGNLCQTDHTNTWNLSISSQDVCFYVYKDNPSGPFPTHLRV